MSMGRISPGIREIQIRNRRSSFPRVNILGVGISAITLDLAVTELARWIESGERRYVNVCTVHTIMECRRDKSMRAIVNRSGMALPRTGCPWSGSATTMGKSKSPGSMDRTSCLLSAKAPWERGTGISSMAVRREWVSFSIWPGSMGCTATSILRPVSSSFHYLGHLSHRRALQVLAEGNAPQDMAGGRRAGNPVYLILT